MILTPFPKGLSFGSGKYLLAGVGQEHRLGRWNRIGSAKNGIALIKLPELLAESAIEPTEEKEEANEEEVVEVDSGISLF